MLLWKNANPISQSFRSFHNPLINMPAPVRLKVGSQWLTTDDLMRGLLPGEATEQENKVIDLCRRWLHGEDTFEFHTSGSTGIPKRITFHRHQLESSARLTEKALHLKAGDTALICLDTAFIAGAMMVIRCLVTGMNMIIQTPSANPLENIQEPIDFAAMVPYQVTTILEEDPDAFTRLRKTIIGGAPLSPDTALKLQHLPGHIYATYGMTETITHVAFQKLNGEGRQDYFELLPGILAKTNEQGCLSLSVPHLGYGWMATHDVVSLFEENKFRWLGRIDRAINSGGIKIQPEKIELVAENIFSQLNIHRRLFVAGLPDQKLGERVALIIEGSPLRLEEEEHVRTKLSGALATYELPRSIHYTEKFAETDTQKIDRPKTLERLRLS